MEPDPSSKQNAAEADAASERSAAGADLLEGRDVAARRKRKADAWSHAQAELIDEIVATAACVTAARAPSGLPLYRTDSVWFLVRVLERSQYCCAIADAGRLLGVSRQRARRIVREAELAGAIELLTNPDDRRIVQMRLTPRTRSQLATARADERLWIGTLLLGLDPQRLAVTTHVLRVIRHRLRRDERERSTRCSAARGRRHRPGRCHRTAGRRYRPDRPVPPDRRPAPPP